MPVVTCPECGHHPLSTFADCCPSCRAPLSVLLTMLQKSTTDSNSKIENAIKIEQDTPTPHLDVQCIIEEFLKLSRSNGSPHTGYLSALERSQRDHWSHLVQEGNQCAMFLIACTERRPEGVTLADRLAPLSDNQHSLSLWVAGDDLAYGGNKSSPKSLRMLKLAWKGGVECAQYAYGYHLDLSCDEIDSPEQDRIESECEAIMEELAKSQFPPALCFLARRQIRRSKDLSSSSRAEASIRDGVRILKEAAQFGCEDAARELATMFEKGRCVSKNTSEAEYWQGVRARLKDLRRKPPESAYGVRELLQVGALKSDSRLIYQDGV